MGLRARTARAASRLMPVERRSLGAWAGPSTTECGIRAACIRVGFQSGPSRLVAAKNQRTFSWRTPAPLRTEHGRQHREVAADPVMGRSGGQGPTPIAHIRIHTRHRALSTGARAVKPMPARKSAQPSKDDGAEPRRPPSLRSRKLSKLELSGRCWDARSRQPLHRRHGADQPSVVAAIRGWDKSDKAERSPP
jgi:hypothetical protein